MGCDRTVGEAALGKNPAVAVLLRAGLFITAIPRQENIILRFEVNGANNQRYTIAEVAVSQKLGKEFFQFVQVALRDAAAVPASDARPWELTLNLQSDSGGTLALKVSGDASQNFTVSWDIASPERPLDSFTVPTALKKPGQEHISVVVDFSTSLQEFAFLQTIYLGGVEQRFHDLPLYPDSWLHLTVTNGTTNRYVNVHFDAIVESGERIFVAEAPASTDVGGRFLAETLARMQEMLNEETAKPGSSGKFVTEFYYDTSDEGVVVVEVTGVHGAFDVAYHLETPTETVK
jgi:hypothetical protein